MIPELYQQYAPYFADYNRKFIEFAAVNLHQHANVPYIFNDKNPDNEINFFITEFFDMYPEMKISLFYFGGTEAIRMENRGIYKLLLHFYKHFERLTSQGVKSKRALELTFDKYDDYVKVKMQETATTQVIAKSLQIRPLLGYLERDSLDTTRNKLARTQRDVELLGLRHQLRDLEELESTVGSLNSGQRGQPHGACRLRGQPGGGRRHFG